MSSFKVFLRWYNKKHVVPTLEAMQRMIAFYHDKDIDMLKLGCTLPNLANICLHKSTDGKFYTFSERDKDLLEKLREHVVAGNFIRKSTNLCKSIVGIDASQLYPTRCVNPSRLVFIRLGISIQKRVDSHLDKTRPTALRIWSCPISNEQDQNVKLKASLQQADRKKLTASVFMGFVLIAALCLKPWDAFTTSLTVKSRVLLLLKKIFNVVARRESSMH